MDEVKLHGHTMSPFSNRVVWALKLKGIPFEHIDEDLPNKSPLLLHYNPVHKKVPVLVHHGKPVCESMIIVEYIDEVWPHNPLMPSDPYQKALAKFWVKFIEDKITPIVERILRSTGEELEKAKTEALEMLTTIEEQGAGESKFFMGDEIGIIDIAFGAMGYWLQAIEQVVEVKVLEAHKFPKLEALLSNFKQETTIKDNLPNQHELFLFFKGLRENLLSFASSSA